MWFLYSRKIQFILLLCWSAGMVGLYVAVIGSDARLFHSKEISQAAITKPSVAQLPHTGVKTSADPTRNKAEALRVSTQTEGGTATLVLEFDYVPAQAQGFVPAKTYSYYIENPSTFVLSLGEHWIMNIEKKTYPVDLPQVSGISLILSQSNHLRILTHTHSSVQAMNARAQISPTATGLQARIHFGK
ncbi:MAG: hypothetical protein LBN33_03905 [Desulfovibrio sp.]|jgi:hypothetical protein|nr:hypothetical protein [Desulfovibrio sp.]